MHQRPTHILVIGLLVATTLSCMREPEVVVPAAQDPEPSRFEGDLRHLVPEPIYAWLRLDMETIRSDDRFAPILEFEMDPGTNALVDSLDGSEELMVAWTDALLGQRINLVRGDVDRASLHSDLRSSDNFAGAPFDFTAVGEHKVWRQSDRSWAISAPADNLVITGHGPSVLGAVDRIVNFDPAGASNRDYADIEGVVILTPLQRQALRLVISSPEIRRRLSSIERIALRGMLGLGLDLQVDLVIAAGEDPADIVALIAAAYLELVAPMAAEIEGTWVDTLFERMSVDVEPATEERHIIQLTWELSSDDVDRLAELLDPTNPVHAEGTIRHPTGLLEGSGEAAAVPDATGESSGSGGGVEPDTEGSGATSEGSGD